MVFKIELSFSPHLQQNGIELCIGVLYIHNFHLLTSTYNLDFIIQSVHSQICSCYTLENIKDQPIIADYRNFYWKYLKIDPTKVRPASEALVRRILGGNSLPTINLFVDVYNWASVESFISLSAYDLAKITFPLHIRFAFQKEIFTAIGSKPKELPESALVVCDTNDSILCQYPHRDAQHSLVTTSSTEIVVLSYGVNNIPPLAIKSSLDIVLKNLTILRNLGTINFNAEDVSLFTNY